MFGDLPRSSKTLPTSNVFVNTKFLDRYNFSVRNVTTKPYLD